MKNPQKISQSIILFDGVCNFCNASVQFVLQRDPKKRFMFAQLQSETGMKLLHEQGLSNLNLSSMVLIQNHQAYTRSTAALKIARHLCLPWPLLYSFILLPRLLRDTIYDFIGKRRYLWFGKTDQCQLIPPEHKERFL